MKERRSKALATILAIFFGNGLQYFYVGMPVRATMYFLICIVGMFMVFIPNIIIYILSLCEIPYIRKMCDEYNRIHEKEIIK